MKRIFTLFLAMMMAMSLSMTAFAGEVNPPGNPTEQPDDDNDDDEKLGTVIINEIHESTQYAIYRILDLSDYDLDANAYPYKVSSGWEDFFASDAAKKYVTVESNGLVKWIWDAANVLENDPIKTLDDASADFAKKALAYVKANDISATKSSANGGMKHEINQQTSKTMGVFDELPLGYYLVDSSMGALCGLTTTDSIGYVNAKNGIPTIDKQVMEDSTNQWGASNTADIAQIVEYRVTINVHAGAENYVLHDTMEQGLTFKQAQTSEGKYIAPNKTKMTVPELETNKLLLSPDHVDNIMKASYRGVWKIEHVVPGTPEVRNEVSTEYYTIVVKEDADDGVDHDTDVVMDGQTCGCSFEIRFTSEFAEHLKTNDKIIIHYNAMLNRDAEIADETNDNTAKLTFGEGGTSNIDTVSTSTFAFDLVKTNENNRLLDGAQFRLYTTSNGTADNSDEIQLVVLKATAFDPDEHEKFLTYRLITKTTNDAGEVVETYEDKPVLFDFDKDGVAEPEETVWHIESYRRARADESGIPIVVNGGVVRISGLDNGNYWLEETKSPAGYNKLTTRQQFTISDNNLYASITGDRYSAGSGVRVQNSTGTLLPETGGTGKILFITIGMIVALGAGVLLVTKKRMSMIR